MAAALSCEVFHCDKYFYFDRVLCGCRPCDDLCDRTQNGKPCEMLCYDFFQESSNNGMIHESATPTNKTLLQLNSPYDGDHYYTFPLAEVSAIVAFLLVLILIVRILLKKYKHRCQVYTMLKSILSCTESINLSENQEATTNSKTENSEIPECPTTSKDATSDVVEKPDRKRRPFVVRVGGANCRSKASLGFVRQNIEEFRKRDKTGACHTITRHKLGDPAGSEPLIAGPQNFDRKQSSQNFASEQSLVTLVWVEGASRGKENELDDLKSKGKPAYGAQYNEISISSNRNMSGSLKNEGIFPPVTYSNQSPKRQPSAAAACYRNSLACESLAGTIINQEDMLQEKLPLLKGPESCDIDSGYPPESNQLPDDELGHNIIQTQSEGRPHEHGVQMEARPDRGELSHNQSGQHLNQFQPRQHVPVSQDERRPDHQVIQAENHSDLDVRHAQAQLQADQQVIQVQGQPNQPEIQLQAELDQHILQLEAESDENPVHFHAEHDQHVAPLHNEPDQQVAPLFNEPGHNVVQLHNEPDQYVAPLQNEHNQHVPVQAVPYQALQDNLPQAANQPEPPDLHHLLPNVAVDWDIGALPPGLDDFDSFESRHDSAIGLDYSIDQDPGGPGNVGADDIEDHIPVGIVDVLNAHLWVQVYMYWGNKVDILVQGRDVNEAKTELLEAARQRGIQIRPDQLQVGSYENAQFHHMAANA